LPSDCISVHSGALTSTSTSSRPLSLSERAKMLSSQPPQETPVLADRPQIEGISAVAKGAPWRK
jgi:hypothetical protein